MVYKITKLDKTIHGKIALPASKSISNRLLMIRALCHEPMEISNLSLAKDTVTLNEQLANGVTLKDAGDAGTAYRFLTAYLAASSGSWVLTGSDRMKERPIGPLVDALRMLGAEINYMEKEGYPPLKITGQRLTGGEVSVSTDDSSQFASALLLIGPTLDGGLVLHLEGSRVSMPYLKMTVSLMREFGVPVKVSGAVVSVPQTAYKGRNFEVESDWSAASYYYALVALSSSASLQLSGLRWDSIQGDRSIVRIMERFGVQTRFHQDGLSLNNSEVVPHEFSYDFKDEPDLAQTVLAVCAALGIPGHFRGMETLKLKETDRIHAMKTELAKVGRHLYEKNGLWHLMAIDRFKLHGPLLFRTYNDHRMAMALACFAMVYDEVFIEQPGVVAKSNPVFWDHLGAMDFTVEDVSSG